jgi:hypothetical protein
MTEHVHKEVAVMPSKRSEESVSTNGQAAAQPPAQTITWDDSEITNCYANVCNVSSSREEVVLVFGVNKQWERNSDDIQVKLNSRVILSPFAAKRMTMLLNNVMQQYEDRFGHMDVGVLRGNDQATTS